MQELFSHNNAIFDAVPFQSSLYNPASLAVAKWGCNLHLLPRGHQPSSVPHNLLGPDICSGPGCNYEDVLQGRYLPNHS